jgi:hypothetical protein
VVAHQLNAARPALSRLVELFAVLQLQLMI